MKKDTILKALDPSETNAFVEWMTTYGKQIIIAFLALFALIFLISRWTSGSTVKAEEDYLTAETQFQAFQKNIAKATSASFKEPLDKLQKIINRHPELHAKYDGDITQTLIAYSTDIPTAITLGNATLKRTKVNQLPNFNEYAAITLLISQNKFDDALKQTIQLKSKLAEKMSDSEQTLSILNLLRYAILLQKTADKQTELATWQEIKNLINSGSPAIKEVLKRFTEGQVSLINYIEAREKILNT